MLVNNNYVSNKKLFWTVVLIEFLTLFALQTYATIARINRLPFFNTSSAKNFLLLEFIFISLVATIIVSLVLKLRGRSIIRALVVSSIPIFIYLGILLLFASA